MLLLLVWYALLVDVMVTEETSGCGRAVRVEGRVRKRVRWINGGGCMPLVL